MPTLYIVATPIGNLEDVSLRALRILKEVELIACEDTRRTRKLMDAYDIKTPLTSYHEHSKAGKVDYILAKLSEGDVALVSDAGMPAVSDPGYELVLAAAERGVAVIPIPGPSVVTTALVVSGLAVDRFLYLGFLPNKAAARRKALKAVVGEGATLVVLESPHRLRSALKDILEVMGDRRIAVCRELTKLHEEVFRGRVSQAAAHFQHPKGEFALVIEGGHEPAPRLTEEIERELQSLRSSGARAREAVSQMAAETGLSRKELYRAWLKLG